MKDGFIKIACATPELKVSDCDFNTNIIIDTAKTPALRALKFFVFPSFQLRDIPVEIFFCKLHCLNLPRIIL